MTKTSFFAQAKEKVLGIRERFLQNGLVKFLIRVFTEFGYDEGTNMAAATAYYLFLSLFPLLLVVIGLLGLFIDSEQVQQQVFNFLQSYIPGSQEALQTNIENVIAMRGTLGIVGLLVLLFTGSNAVSASAHAINLAWDVPKEMFFILKKLRDIGLTIFLGILGLMALGASIALSFTNIEDIPIFGSALVQVIARIIIILLYFIIFLILFKVAPNTRTYWRHLWLGALVTAILFELGRTVTFIYLTQFADYRLVYGSLASVIVLLVWIYYSATIMVLGAEFTAEYGRMRRGISRGFPSHSIAQPEEAGYQV